MKRGQAAMEFLMTYGWAILVVIAAIAALAYFGVLDPGRLLPQVCQSSEADVPCNGKASISATSVIVPLKNNIGAVMELSSFGSSYNNCTTRQVSIGGAAAVDYPVNISNGQEFNLVFSGCNFQGGQVYDGDVVITYTNLNNKVNFPNRPIKVRGRIG